MYFVSTTYVFIVQYRVVYFSFFPLPSIRLYRPLFMSTARVILFMSAKKMSRAERVCRRDLCWLFNVYIIRLCWKVPWDFCDDKTDLDSVAMNVFVVALFTFSDKIHRFQSKFDEKSISMPFIHHVYQIGECYAAQFDAVRSLPGAFGFFVAANKMQFPGEAWCTSARNTQLRSTRAALCE